MGAGPGKNAKSATPFNHKLLVSITSSAIGWFVHRLIADNVEGPEMEQLQERFVIFNMKPNTSVRELLWTLALPDESAAAS